MAMGIPKKWKTEYFKRNAPAPLKFGPDGKFKILHITDIHCVQPVMDDDENREIPDNKHKETINVIEQLVAKTNPDLVVFGGDNISGYWEEFTYDYVRQTIEDITEPIRKRNIPLGVVFGNHDGEMGFHTEFQMMMYMEYDNCRSNLNDEDVYGCGNCCLTVKDSKGEKDALAIWLVDSNDYEKDSAGHRVYDHVHDSQIEWYERKAAQLKRENGGNPVPAVLFQHMPVQQMMALSEVVAQGEPYDYERHGTYYRTHNLISGRMREEPSPANLEKDYTNQFKSWKKTGDIFAAFFGHDHVNDFHANIEGIDVYQTLGAGYFTYGEEHGGRIIVFDENKPRTLETESIEIPRITDTKFD